MRSEILTFFIAAFVCVIAEVAHADEFSTIKGPAKLTRTNGFAIRGNLRSMNSKQVRIIPSGSNRITELKASDVEEITVAGETYTYNTESRTFENRKALAEAARIRQIREQQEADERRKREQQEARERQIRERENAIVDWTEKRDGVEDALIAITKVFGEKYGGGDQATVLGIAAKGLKAAEAEDQRVKIQEETGYRNPILSRSMRFTERREIMERVHKVTLARKSITIYESGGGVIRNVIPGENTIRGRHTFWTKQGKMYLCFSYDGAGFLIPMLEVLGLESNGELLYGERTPVEQQKSVADKHQAYFSRWKDAATEATRLKRQMVADSGDVLAEAARRTASDIASDLGAKGTNSGDSQATSNAGSKQEKTKTQTPKVTAPKSPSGRTTEPIPYNRREVKVIVRYSDGSKYTKKVISYEHGGPGPLAWSGLYESPIDGSGVGSIKLPHVETTVRFYIDGNQTKPMKVKASDKEITVPVP